MKHAEFPIMHGIDETLLSPSSMKSEAYRPLEYPGMEVERLHELVMSIIVDKEALKLEKNRTLWIPMFKYALDMLNHHDCGSLGKPLLYYEGIAS